MKRSNVGASWKEIVWRAVHQLQVLKPDQQFFHYYQDICLYIDHNWNLLANGKEKTSTWQNTVSSTITTNKKIFKAGPDHGFWGLRISPKDSYSDAEIVAMKDSLLPSEIALPPSSPHTFVGNRKRKNHIARRPSSPYSRPDSTRPVPNSSSWEDGSITDEDALVDIEGVSESEFSTNGSSEVNLSDFIDSSHPLSPVLEALFQLGCQPGSPPLFQLPAAVQV